MLRVISMNLNGIRSANKKGFFDWMQSINADFICIQEIRAQENDLLSQMINPNGFYSIFNYAQKKGYSGVGLYCRQKPDNIQYGIGVEKFDCEGRYIRADFGSVSIISLYLPSGSSGDERQQVKFDFLAAFLPILRGLIAERREFILCGDFNIAHQEIDLKNFRANKTHSGFLPEERAWMSQVLGDGWVDTWRALYPEVPGYTWWSNRGRAYANNVGWRIDYQLATPNIAKLACGASVYKEQKFSDHAPLIVDYEWLAACRT